MNKKVYITRYAVTKGILEYDDYSDCGSVGGEIIMISVKNKYGYDDFYHGQDFHFTREDAIRRANEMKEKKIKSLEKQLDKVKTLEF